MSKKRKKLSGKVEKIIKSSGAGDPDKAQIGIEGADHLYREIRVENVVADDKGQKAALKEGAQVDVIVEADSEATTPRAQTDNKN
jgi:hypothetical protein